MTKKAYDSWQFLRGVVCVYKPPDTSYKYVLYKLKDNICKELNKLETRPPRKCIMVDRSDDEISITVRPSYADNVLCAGPRYQNHQIRTSMLTHLSDLSSGVFLVCVNDRNYLASVLKKLSFTRCYHIKGILGQATTDYYINGQVIGRATYDKVQKSCFENVLASYQSSLQARVFDEYGLPLQSQEAYNFAVKGLYRPTWKGPTIIYSLKIVEFEPPNFTLEVQCINETEVYLMNLIHNLGVSLKCYATCAGIRCLRQGCFHIEHSLAKNQWNVNNIIDNIKLTWEILEKNYPKILKFSPEVTTHKSVRVQQ